MDFLKVVGWVKGHRSALAVVSLILVFAGADLLINPPKAREFQWLSLPLLGTGLLLFVLLLWPTARPGPRPPSNTLAGRLLSRLFWGGRLIPFFPVFGILIVIAVLVFNRFASTTPDLLTHDQAALFFASVLIAYRFVPSRLDRERDFVFLFALFLAGILLVPLLILRLVSGDSSASVDAYSSAALAPQTSALLKVIGIDNLMVYDSTLSAPGLAFTTSNGTYIEVYITTACSGLYSLAIFSSAFSAYVLTEQTRLTRSVVVFFALGLALAYLANILRMVVIVWVGYTFDDNGDGVQNLLVAHSSVGWLIFLAWIAVFWMLLFRFLPPAPRPAGDKGSEVPRRGAFCGVCGIVLTPAIAGARCSCGKLYHSECLLAEGRCPHCSTPAVGSAPDQTAV